MEQDTAPPNAELGENERIRENSTRTKDAHIPYSRIKANGSNGWLKDKITFGQIYGLSDPSANKWMFHELRNEMYQRCKL